MNRLGIGILGLLVGGLSCASPTPDWVGKGTRVSPEAPRTLYGLGARGGIKNEELARTAAENAARNEVAELFKSFTTRLVKCYEARVGAESNGAVAEVSARTPMQGFLSSLLTTVKIAKRWRNPEDGTTYALAQFQLREFTEPVEQLELPGDKKAAVLQCADRAYVELGGAK